MADSTLRRFAKERAELIASQVKSQGLNPAYSAGYFQAMEDVMRWEDSRLPGNRREDVTTE